MGKKYYHLLLGLYFAALLICGACRILLKMRFIDPDTGFYVVQNGIVSVFNIGILVTVLVLFAANRLRRVTNDYPVHQNSRFAGFLCLLVGASIVIYAFLGQPYPVMEQNYSETLLEIRRSISIVLGCIAGLSMIWMGVNGLLRKTTRYIVVLALFGSLWQAFMLITRFNSFTVLTTISDNLLAILFMVFASLFFVGHARTTFGLTRKDGRNYAIPTGLCTSLIGLLLVVPNYLYMGLRHTAMPAPMLGLWESVYILLLSIYALVFVLNMVRSIKQV